jgi:hypothetical protein
MTGMAMPLTYERIEAWARMTGRTPDVLEVEGLIYLDAAARNPAKEPEE